MSLLNSHWLTSTGQIYARADLMQNGQGSKFVSNLQDPVSERFCSHSSCPVSSASSHLSWGNSKLVFTEETNAKAPNVKCAVIITVVKMDSSQTKGVLLWHRAIQCSETPCGLPTPIRTRWPRGPNLPLHDFCQQVRPAMAWGLQWVLTAFVTTDYQTDPSYPAKW